MQKKYFIFILTILTAFILGSCGQQTVEEQRAALEKSNKEKGGVGVHYNYNGPNSNPSGVSKIDE